MREMGLQQTLLDKLEHKFSLRKGKAVAASYWDLTRDFRLPAGRRHFSYKLLLSAVKCALVVWLSYAALILIILPPLPRSPVKYLDSIIPNRSSSVSGFPLLLEDS